MKWDKIHHKCMISVKEGARQHEMVVSHVREQYKIG